MLVQVWGLDVDDERFDQEEEQKHILGEVGLCVCGPLCVYVWVSVFLYTHVVWLSMMTHLESAGRAEARFRRGGICVYLCVCVCV